MAARSDEPDDAAGLLLSSAWLARWRAPELAATLARHVGATAGDTPTRVGADAVAASVAFRLGGSRAALPGALAAMHTVEASGVADFRGVPARDVAAALRVDIAGCAATVGRPDAAFAVLRPVFAPDAASTPRATRAAGLVRLARALSREAGRPELGQALRAADGLYEAETELHAGTVTALRGLLRAVMAARRRRAGDASRAVEVAADGLRSLPGDDALSSEGAHARARLTQELVCALLDRGERDAAQRFAAPVLATTVRAQDAGSSGWLRLLLAERVHRLRGEYPRAQGMLREAAAIAARYRRHGLLAAAQQSLAELEEAQGDTEQALLLGRDAHASARAAAGQREHARAALDAEFPERESHEELFAVLRSWLGALDTRSTSEAAERPIPEPEPEPAESAGGRRRRHRADATGSFAVNAVPGIVVAEGTGGRRRAPEPEVEAEPEPESGAATPASSHAEDGTEDSGGRHGAKDIGARIASSRQRASGRALVRQARHAADHDGDADEDTAPEPTAVDVPSARTEPQPDPVPGAPDELADTYPAQQADPVLPAATAASPDAAPVAHDPDLGLADLLTEALAAFRDGDTEDGGVRTTGEPVAEQANEEPEGAHAPGKRPGIQWRLGDGVADTRPSSSG